MPAFKQRIRLLSCVSWLAMASNVIAPIAFAAEPVSPADTHTATPVKHVIVIYGENRSFDHLFATYKPVSGDKVMNLLSEGIVNADGTPGPNYKKAMQYQATDTTTFSISPTKTAPYTTLPPPLAGGNQFASDTNPPPFATTQAAAMRDTGLLPSDMYLLTTGATGLAPHSIDTRIANVTQLPGGPFQLSPGLPYDAYANSPVHRYYQMYQQADCSAANATKANPSGCLNDLFPWVEVTIGAGSNGKPQPQPFTDATTGEGSTAMGFYNVQQGDMPYFKQLADEYSISDNYHQPAMGGTGLDSIIAGFGDAVWFADANGNPATPPMNQIENPDPEMETNNYYSQDGYSGGSYSACADMSQKGVPSVVNYLQSLPTKVNPNCEPGHSYLLNNYNPGFAGNGTQLPLGPNNFTIPPVPQKSIGDVLEAAGLSFHWYGEDWNNFVANPSTSVYCTICNPFLYQSHFMENATLRTEVNKDTSDFYNDIQNNSLPAVSFVKPDGLNDGHPASSKFSIYEAFVRKILTELRSKPDLWNSTAVFITVDEGGGYYDSGYIQPLDFFGDGTRIPMIVVSPWTRGGHVAHTYSDHVSVLKFIEANWHLPTISGRSRDNLPNPIQHGDNPYVPVNGPSIGNMMDMFHFGHDDDHHDQDGNRHAEQDNHSHEG
jgi:phospholipase C